MNATTCPSCGLVTEIPHETQEACIEALHHEIARVRGILHHVKEPGERRVVPAPSDDGEEADVVEEADTEQEPVGAFGPHVGRTKGAVPVL